MTSFEKIESLKAIERHMKVYVNHYFDSKLMREKIIKYINYHKQNQFPFGNMTLLIYEHYNKNISDDVYKLAAITEILVLIFDIFDDLVDKDNYSSPWLTEPEVSINIGMGLIFSLYQAINDLQTFDYCKEHVKDLLTKFGLQTIHGQYLDSIQQAKSEKEYLNLITKKSSSLCIFAMQLGAVAATNSFNSKIEELALNIGIAAQIKNDLADILRFDKKNDLLNRKITLCTIYLLNQKDKRYDFIRAYYSNSINQAEFLLYKSQLERLVNESGVIQYGLVMRVLYGQQVIKQCAQLKFPLDVINQIEHYT